MLTVEEFISRLCPYYIGYISETKYECHFINIYIYIYIYIYILINYLPTCRRERENVRNEDTKTF